MTLFVRSYFVIVNLQWYLFRRTNSYLVIRTSYLLLAWCHLKPLKTAKFRTSKIKTFHFRLFSETPTFAKLFLS
jgi:hypothetical protein